MFKLKTFDYQLVKFNNFNLMNPLHDEVIIKIADYGSQEYKQTLLLRDEMTRKPHGLSLYDEDLNDEKNQVHFIAIHKATSQIIGNVILTPLGDEIVKLRQLLVVKDFQKRGIGSKLVFRFIEFCKKTGVKKIKLDSIHTAKNFYLKLDFKVVSNEVLVLGLPHYLMEKDI